MRTRLLAFLAALLLAPIAALAQSTADQVVTGYLTTSGCPAGYTSCFVQYGPAGAGSSITISGPLGTQTLANSVAVTDLSSQPGGALYNAVTGAIPAGTNLIGSVNVTPNNASTGLIQATASAKVTTASAATLQVVAASGSTVIYVTGWDLVTTLANNVTWESGDTGGSCANPVALTGAYPFAANGGATRGGGLGPVLVLPAGKALCMLTSAATQISGSVAFAQF